MNKNSVAIFVALALGFFFREGQQFSFLIKYLLMIMLFFPFLSLSLPQDRRIYRHVLVIFFAMLGLAISLYLGLMEWNRQVATAAFLVAFTPTATASPVVIGLLKKNVEFVVTAVVITNALVAFCLPFVIPFILEGTQADRVWEVFSATMTVFLLPLAIAQSVKTVAGNIAERLKRWHQVVFAIWLVLLYIAMSKASSYLLDQSAAWSTLLPIVLLTLLICWLNFNLGRMIGGADYALEAAQSLGQKNTLFMTWVALEYFDSIVVIGPVVYIVYQNIYNSWLLLRKRPPM